MEAEHPDPSIFIDWAEFWQRDRNHEEWLLPPILARGRGHAVYAPHKVGKSLVLLWAAKLLSTGEEPVTVIYLDYEMSDEDLYERLDSMGAGPDTNLARLRYAQLPSIPPLDTAQGAKRLLDIVDYEQREWPEHHLAVIIDTTSRAVMGEENSADTIRDFYRFTGLGLKQRGVTWVRVDHAGKDGTKGQRGSRSSAEAPGFDSKSSTT